MFLVCFGDLENLITALLCLLLISEHGMDNLITTEIVNAEGGSGVSGKGKEKNKVNFLPLIDLNSVCKYSSKIHRIVL